MNQKFSSTALKSAFRGRFIYLLIAILVMIIGNPFLDLFFPYPIIQDIILTFLFVSGIYAISNKKRDIFIGLCLAIPACLTLWSFYIHKIPGILIFGEFLVMLFIGFTIYCLVETIYRQKEVTGQVVYAAVIIYLLMAILWSSGYVILDYFYPGSFGYPGGIREDSYRFLYFSFITITTLGYGDIIPQTELSNSLAVLEAVSGQMYLVVVVAWLVGMHVSQRTSKS